MANVPWGVTPLLVMVTGGAAWAARAVAMKLPATARLPKTARFRVGGWWRALVVLFV